MAGMSLLFLLALVVGLLGLMALIVFIAPWLPIWGPA